MSKLILAPGSAQAVTRELTDALITIGRSPENMIVLDDPSVSSRHAQLSQVGESFHLQDLDSTNGTRVNGEKITSVALRVGDRIRFGKVEACFECETAEAAGVSAPGMTELAPVLTKAARASGGFRKCVAVSEACTREGSGAHRDLCRGRDCDPRLHREHALACANAAAGDSVIRRDVLLHVPVDRDSPF